jgi:hypothetical protein
MQYLLKPALTSWHGVRPLLEQFVVQIPARHTAPLGHSEVAEQLPYHATDAASGLNSHVPLPSQIPAPHVLPAATFVVSHRRWQPVPTMLSRVHGFGLPEHVVGQPPSHNSSPVTTPSPHTSWQSLSLPALALLGQQPSPFVFVSIAEWRHCTLQSEVLPTEESNVHGSLSSQDTVQLAPSQSSPGSLMPLPHFGRQSTSKLAFAPGKQQPSPPIENVLFTRVHVTLHNEALPFSVSIVHGSLSSQDDGQSPSQTSELLTTPSPHRGPRAAGAPAPPAWVGREALVPPLGERGAVLPAAPVDG